MTTLTILPSGKTTEFTAGTNLLKAILDAGEKLVSKCGGEAKCGASKAGMETKASDKKKDGSCGDKKPEASCGAKK